MKNNSKVLALKYRPQSFEDLIGQEIVSETIYKSIKADKTPNAFLFTGIRGVGKTTTARIVAKSLNCLNGVDKICKDNFCTNCDSIVNSNHIDVLEMDAASKTSVDDVRDLIEFSRYPPTSAKYKIFIIDEVHMLSKQAFNALLKTLEEPPEYLKFIFATTEIKKIPITVVSRCQRFDLSRVRSNELFNYIKKIKDKENGKISDEALKLIIKISEGSVRDALSLLDRAIMSQIEEKELDLKSAQKIFGYFDKSFLIDLFKFLFEGNEKEVINVYRSIYDQGVDPKNFLNDFLEILYYFKNISSIKLGGTNFSLNDDEFEKISELSKKINSETLMLYWQFTLNAFNELEIVSNQNLSIEMFLVRLMYLKEMSKNNDFLNFKDNDDNEKINQTNKNQIKIDQNIENLNLNNKTVSQIKNFFQEKKAKPKNEIKDAKGIIEIDSFDSLIEICNKKKEIRLKYELENNVRLVSFEKERIEISFNENLDKDFVKNLSNKLFEWTNSRWIISLSKKHGSPSKKQEQEVNKKKIFNELKESEVYKKILETFDDAELIDVKLKKKND